MKLHVLIGSGHKIIGFAAPFIVIGLALNIWKPLWFSVKPLFPVLYIASVIMLIPGVILWAWSALLILKKVPKKELIINGPYKIIKHPLYTVVSLLVLPSIGFICNSWLGLLIGLIIYIGNRVFSPEEEQILSTLFHEKWETYKKNVLIPWL